MNRITVGFLILLLIGCASQNRPLQLISGAGPIYPPAAKEAGTEGFVTLRYAVSARGIVERVEIVASEPAGVFDDAAIAALKSWKFNPMRVDGEPVASGLRESTIAFRLGGGDEYDGY